MVIEVQEDVIMTEWWTSKDGIDGKSQVTRETVHGKNPGRSNETTGSEQALLECERKIRKKMEEGYVKSIDEALAEKLRSQRTEMAKKVLEKDQALQDKIQNG